MLVVLLVATFKGRGCQGHQGQARVVQQGQAQVAQQGGMAADSLQYLLLQCLAGPPHHKQLSAILWLGLVPTQHA